MAMLHIKNATNTDYDCFEFDSSYYGNPTKVAYKTLHVKDRSNVEHKFLAFKSNDYNLYDKISRQKTVWFGDGTVSNYKKTIKVAHKKGYATSICVDGTAYEVASGYGIDYVQTGIPTGTYFAYNFGFMLGSLCSNAPGSEGKWRVAGKINSNTTVKIGNSAAINVQNKYVCLLESSGNSSLYLIVQVSFLSSIPSSTHENISTDSNHVIVYMASTNANSPTIGAIYNNYATVPVVVSGSPLTISSGINL